MCYFPSDNGVHHFSVRPPDASLAGVGAGAGAGLGLGLAGAGAGAGGREQVHRFGSEPGEASGNEKKSSPGTWR